MLQLFFVRTNNFPKNIIPKFIGSHFVIYYSVLREAIELALTNLNRVYDFSVISPGQLQSTSRLQKL